MSFQIETERLIIRDVREEDIAVLLPMYAEPEARENILSSQWDDAFNRKHFENGRTWIGHPQREYYQLSVALKTDGTLIGSCNISKVRPESFETNIGWHYGHKYRGNGYATEVARKLLYVGFELNEVNEIYADCFAGNKASIRIMEKIGMISTLNLGLFPMIRGWWTYGESKPTLRYTISRHEWLAKTN